MLYKTKDKLIQKYNTETWEMQYWLGRILKKQICNLFQAVFRRQFCDADAGSAPGTSDVQVSQSGLTEGDDSQALDDYFLVVGVDPADVSPFN